MACGRGEEIDGVETQVASRQSQVSKRHRCAMMRRNNPGNFLLELFSNKWIHHNRGGFE